MAPASVVDMTQRGPSGFLNVRLLCLAFVTCDPVQRIVIQWSVRTHFFIGPVFASVDLFAMPVGPSAYSGYHVLQRMRPRAAQSRQSHVNPND